MKTEQQQLNIFEANFLDVLNKGFKRFENVLIEIEK
jgi:hypothetical protein